MALTRAEKTAGRVFLDAQTAKLLAATEKLKTEAEAEGRQFYVVPPFIAKFRHLCPKRGNISTSMSLVEEYVFSPGYVVYELSPNEGSRGRTRMVALPLDVSIAEDLDVVDKHDVLERRFGFWYKRGKCNCGATAQSKVGKFVDAYERPPLKGREAR